jgi:hypothetical protein
MPAFQETAEYKAKVENHKKMMQTDDIRNAKLSKKPRESPFTKALKRQNELSQQNEVTQKFFQIHIY